MLTPGSNQPAHDLVTTPRALAAEVIGRFPLRGTVLDPCRGDGAFYDQFPDGVEREWCELNQGRNFYDWTEPCDWIATNPPWSHMRTWIKHCLTLAPDVVLLCTLTHFVTKARLRDLAGAGYGLREFYCVVTPRAPWPASGFQLGAMHIQRGWDGPLAITGHVGC